MKTFQTTILLSKVIGVEQSILMKTINHSRSLGQNIRELDISPPYSISETASLLSEAKSISLQIRSFINKQLQAVTSLQNLIDILNHDISDLFMEMLASQISLFAEACKP